MRDLKIMKELSRGQEARLLTGLHLLHLKYLTYQSGRGEVKDVIDEANKFKELMNKFDEQNLELDRVTGEILSV